MNNQHEDNEKFVVDINITPKTAYYAYTKQYSSRSPRKYPKEVGKLCKKVFENIQKG